ncbi:MAG: hypothetical protein IJY36_05490 [Coprobacter sp.]|nr:hypothetical protein [Coprobacter sp.]
MLRGGSWNNNATNCRVSNRNNNTPDNRNNNNGFRLSQLTTMDFVLNRCFILPLGVKTENDHRCSSNSEQPMIFFTY